MVRDRNYEPQVVFVLFFIKDMSSLNLESHIYLYLSRP